MSVSASQVLIEDFSSSFIVSFSRADWDKCLFITQQLQVHIPLGGDGGKCLY